ncbi:DUF4956 domain-containing protein [Microbacterium horticulturae]|uniref:DUF4956 domain-containing protein n=1 Tax=Microbacterium horticulturae TaxID=3028316 RepID=A0ABY8BVN4_9MICO|nr:DUF4956 domain-containing protein [Microbacterium sp. KACC 23027]WEG08246.1 DUF4956 domain-containing protein [Microbacterium sp. KACC 23027]
MTIELLIALATDLVAITLLAVVLYFRRHRRRDLMLSYIALNVGVVAVTIALGSVQVGIGLGIGLFGILSIIRLRSDQITQGEIAYYFIALTLGLLAGLRPAPIWIVPMLSALLIAVMAIVDSPLVAPRALRHTLTLDRAITRPDALRAELERVLGATITRVEVLDVDLVRDITVVDVRYRMPRRSAAAQTAAAQTATAADRRALSQSAEQAAPRQEERERIPA